MATKKFLQKAAYTKPITISNKQADSRSIYVYILILKQQADNCQLN